MLSHGPGRLTCGLTLVVLLAAWGCARKESPRAGVVVESCRAGEAADVAGLRVGDIVVEWRRDRVSGEVESPYHLTMVEQELAPYGPVELLLGSGERVVVTTGCWGADYRPVLAGPDLPAHLQSDLNTAEELYLEALEVVSGVAPGSPTECSLLGNLGLVARKRGDFAAARSFSTSTPACTPSSLRAGVTRRGVVS